MKSASKLLKWRNGTYRRPEETSTTGFENWINELMPVGPPLTGAKSFFFVQLCPPSLDIVIHSSEAPVLKLVQVTYTLSRDGSCGSGPTAIHSLSLPGSTAAMTAGAKLDPLS